jgi:hypothetical protein
VPRMKLPAHPGRIEFVDESTGATTVTAASEVPATVAYVQRNDVWIPVTRVVAVTEGKRRTILSYGEDGTLLSSLAQRQG